MDSLIKPLPVQAGSPPPSPISRTSQANYRTSLSQNLTKANMTNQEEQKINLPDTLSDFASALREHGPILVAHDMRKYFPERHSEYISASLNLERQRQVAALFKPPTPPSV
jgi:hypothetical protein